MVINKIKHNYDLVGYVPSIKPTKKGYIDLPLVKMSTECDIKLSIQYDRIVKETENCFNVHTGLLPNYGGTNILDYTILNNEHEQGLTFHKMTDKLDYGPIVSKVTYPVFAHDNAYTLYKRLLSIGPDFVLSSLELLKGLSYEDLQLCEIKEPKLYRRGEFKVDKRIKNYDRFE